MSYRDGDGRSSSGRLKEANMSNQKEVEALVKELASARAAIDKAEAAIQALLADDSVKASVPQNAGKR